MLVLLLLISSCSKENQTYSTTTKNGITTIKNSGKFSDQTQNLNPKLAFSIKGENESTDNLSSFSAITDLEVDKQGNIYLLDQKSSTIKKFSSKGKFLMSFGGKGNGPGEFQAAYDFALLEDTIYVKEFPAKALVKYDLSGNFLGSFNFKEIGMDFGPSLKAFQDKLIGYVNGVKREDNKVLISNNLALLNSKHEELTKLREYEFIFNPKNVDFFGTLSFYCFSNTQIYVAENSETEYKINIFDQKGQKIREIANGYRKLSYNNYENKEINTNLNLAVNEEKLKDQKRFKKAITNIWFDKYNRLLVYSSMERDEKNKNDFIVDIFSEEGIFLNRVMVPEFKGFGFLTTNMRTHLFHKKFIYEIDPENNVVNVYDY